MAYVMLKNWIKEYLTYQDLDAEFGNVYNGMNDLDNRKVNVADCVSTNTPLKVVKRDADGNFAGNLQGNASNGFQCGDFKPWAFSSIPAGWLLLNGKTIGDSLSGATARANADVQNLFVMIWNDYNNTLCPIYDYNGVATTRGMSALDDFNAHKRLSLMDWRGRTIIGLDNIGGTSANVVTNTNADILGGTGGEEKHTLTTAELPHLTYLIPGGTADSLEVVGMASVNANSLAWCRSYAGRSTGSGSGITAVDDTNGGGSHNNMQPWVALNYIIKY